MSKLELYKKLITKAKENGYKGQNYMYQIGYILDRTNIYSVIFREDFAKAIWGEEVRSTLALPTDEDFKNISMFESSIRYWPKYKQHLAKLSVAEDKWKYLEENVNFDN